ncbi:hypothetical protein [Arthrobacter cryoconiti]|uniref:Uncharacterized protein n=1 Tax=Arthrobacter cryoconiti TaxID=748907 RepID=A0ABV8R4X4_9MICC|nr:hypothetical protein [Arthrobacter cryoconiti]MCC9069347.1 hypothetical protein [Arthrobacter cryoconiti]
MTADNKLSALGGLKRTAQPQPSPVVELVPEAPANDPTPQQPAPQEDAVTATPVAVTPTANQEAAAGGGAAGENLTIRASKELIKAYEAHKNRTKLSFANVLFNAIDSTYQQLPTLLNTNQVKVPGPNLFGRGEAVAMISADHSEKDSKSMRINSKHMAVLDNLATELAGGNRNRLIVTALTEYLKDEI